VDESHFHVLILACPDCSQQFVSKFTETVDWAGGDDAQFWTLFPVSPGEAGELAGRDGAAVDMAIAVLGAGRRHLRRDYPSGGESRIYWSGADS